MAGKQLLPHPQTKSETLDRPPLSCVTAKYYASKMNYWFWLLIILIPAIVFSVKPEANIWWRVGRLLFAIAFSYAIANGQLHWRRAQHWEAYEACQSQFSDGGIKHHKECPEINIGDGASLVFFLYLGWLPITGYTGFWELIWRLHHRKSIRQQAAFPGRRFSNALIIFSIIAAYPTWTVIFDFAYFDFAY